MPSEKKAFWVVMFCFAACWACLATWTVAYMFPLAREGYDQRVLDHAGVSRTAQIDESLLDAPIKPRGMK